MTDYGHSLNLTVGWYHNNCRYAYSNAALPTRTAATACAYSVHTLPAIRTTLTRCVPFPVLTRSAIFLGNRCHDHCTSPVCFAADVNATLALGFDSVKLDGCGAEEDVALWAELFNHSVRVAGSTAGG